MTDVVPASTNPLGRLTQARALLEASHDLTEIKSIRDTALAAQEYARAKKLGQEAERYAAEIAARAERRLGQLLAETPKAQGQRTDRLSTAAELSSTPRQDVGKKVSARSQKLAQIPDAEFEQHIQTASRVSADRLARIQRDREAQERRIKQARAEAAAQTAPTAADIWLGDFREIFDDLEEVDAIITDPPYPAEFLPLLSDLAAWADKVLTDDGVLAVLIGQTHLPEVYRRLEGHRPYRWTAAYLTPGGGYVSHARRVQSNWKPLIVYGGGPRFGDVITSEGADADAKTHHRWGQDYNAFHTIIERLTLPRQKVVDPFMGSGTTLLAAKALGRHAIGCDTDPAAVATARERLS